mgnify:CR=1 FL=1
MVKMKSKIFKPWDFSLELYGSSCNYASTQSWSELFLESYQHGCSKNAGLFHTQL